LLTYFDTLRKLPPAELARASELARKRYLAEKTAVRQMQYALTLAVPGGDAEHAQQLLEPLTKEGQRDRELRGLAVLLSVDLTERQRLDDSLQAQTRRADELARQLEALKNVEKQMLQRDVPGSVKP
jgi:acyl-CoA hydrolase